MLKRFLILLIFTISALFSFKVSAQFCNTTATLISNLSFTSTFQSAPAQSSGRPYWTFTATAGCVYEFSTCTSAGGNDTYLRIYSGTTPATATQVAFNDDSGPFCNSTKASISWLCTTSGTYSILLTRYTFAGGNCQTLSNSQTLQYRAICPSSASSPCPTYSTTPTSPSTACGNQAYNFQLPLVSCNGTVNFLVYGNYGSSFGSEITWSLTSVLTGAVVASGGPGINSGVINTALSLNPQTVGNSFTLTVNDSWGDGFSGGGNIQVLSPSGVALGQISGNFGSTASNTFNVNANVSAVNVSVTTPTGVQTQTVSNCQNVFMPITLSNGNFCSTTTVNLPWSVTCVSTGAVLASGTKTVTVYPNVPTSASDLVNINWNSSNCTWQVTPQNGCLNSDIGNIITISPDPSSLPSGTFCSSGSQVFTVGYNGISGGPNCCSTGGPQVPITYNTTVTNATVSNSPFGGTNNAALITIPASGTGGNATALTLNINMSGYCFNPPSTGTATDYWVTVYHNGTVVLDQQSVNPGPATYSNTLNLASIAGYNQNSFITIYIYPNAFSAGGVNTTFSPGITCPPSTDGNWTGNFNVSFSSTFQQTTSTAVNCSFSTPSINYSCASGCCPTASISYAGPYCSSNSSLQSPSLTGTGAYTGGTYSSTAGLSINSSTGAINPSLSTPGTYTVTYAIPASGACPSTNVTTTIVISAPTTPTFTQVGPYCSGVSIPAMPTTSNNGIAGSWSPSINNTATTTYTFTPTSTAAPTCATTTTMTITINAPTTPTFTQVGPYCSGASIPALPTTSNNGIAGSWSPAINNTATTTYTFTPTSTAAPTCATTTTMIITISAPTTPTFTQVPAICSGGSLSALPTTSNNSIAGSWSPALNNTATTTYTFTPTSTAAPTCATTATMTITVNQPPIINTLSPP